MHLVKQIARAWCLSVGVVALVVASDGAAADTAASTLLYRQMPATLSHLLHIPVQVADPDTTRKSTAGRIVLDGLRVPVIVPITGLSLEANGSIAQLAPVTGGTELNLTLPRTLAVYSDAYDDMNGLRVGEATLEPSSLQMRWAQAQAMPDSVVLQVKNLKGRAQIDEDSRVFNLAALSLTMSQSLVSPARSPSAGEKILRHTLRETMTGLKLEDRSMGNLSLARAELQQDLAMPVGSSNASVNRLNTAIWGTSPFDSEGRPSQAALAAILSRLQPVLAGQKGDRPGPQGHWQGDLSEFAISVLNFGDLSIHDARATATLGGAEQDAATLSLKGQANGIGVAGFAPETLVLAPQQGRVDVTVTQLPVLALLTTLSADARGGARFVMGHDSPSSPITKSLLRTLRTNGTHVVLNALSVTAQALSLDATGAVTLSDRTKSGLFGTLDIDIAGLEVLIPRLAQMALGDPELAPLVPALTIVQAMGQQTRMPNGRAGRHFHVEFTLGGQMLVNGVDLAPLINRTL
jgi:hypothetical protein